MKLPHTYRSQAQRVFATGMLCLVGAFGLLGAVTGAQDGRGELAAVGIVVLAGSVTIFGRLARCAVVATSDAAIIHGFLFTARMPWSSIERFEYSDGGPCLVRLKSRRTLGITGLQATNISRMKRGPVPEQQWIEQLNRITEERTASHPEAGFTPPTPRLSGGALAYGLAAAASWLIALICLAAAVTSASSASWAPAVGWAASSAPPAGRPGCCSALRRSRQTSEQRPATDEAAGVGARGPALHGRRARGSGDR